MLHPVTDEGESLHIHYALLPDLQRLEAVLRAEVEVAGIGLIEGTGPCVTLATMLERADSLCEVRLIADGVTHDDGAGFPFSINGTLRKQFLVDTYSHAIPALQEEAAAKVAAAVDGG